MEGVCIICLTSGSGIPVFTRLAGNVSQLPFPVIGSLNAVHMFAANQNSDLKSTSTEDARIVWKEFHDSLVLIAVTGRAAPQDEVYLQHLLGLVWDSLVLLHGLDQLLNVRSVDRFKKDVRVCYHLLDTLILQESSSVLSDVTNTAEGLICTEAALLQSFLEAFVEAADSIYGCLLVHHRLVVATPKWWALSPKEVLLLNLLTASLPSCSSRDLPIYLPQGSPNVPHRLLTFELMRNVEVCVICGPKPSLASLEKEIPRFWVPAFETLKSVRQIYPRCVPQTLELDHNALGYLLVNTSRHHSVSSVCLCNDPIDQDQLRRRRVVLRHFYKTAVGSYLSHSVGREQNETDTFTHTPKDTYTVYKAFKCYAHSSDHYQLFMLFSPKIPTYAMRSVCQKTLMQILKDKSLFI